MRFIDALCSVCANRRIRLSCFIILLIILATIFFVFGAEDWGGYTYIGIAFLNAAIILCIYEYICQRRLPTVTEEERIIRAWDRNRFVNGWEQEDDDAVSSSELDRTDVV
jgi:hypothetical protein